MTLDLIAVALAAIAVWRSAPRPRAVGLLAALVMGVAAGSIRRLEGWNSLAALRSDLAVNAGGLLFLNVITGLVLLGLVLSIAARPGLLSILVAVAGAWAAAPLWQLPGITRSVGIAAAIVAGAALVWLVVGWLRPGRFLVALDRRFLDPAGGSGVRDRIAWQPTAPFLATVAFVAMAVLIPHLWTVLGATTLALVATWRTQRPAGWRAAPILVAAGLSLLVLLWSVRLSGPLGGWIPDLVDGPFSPRAALLLAAMVAGAVLIIAGSWPLHRLAAPDLVLPLVIPLAGTFGALLIPDGLRYWQPLLAPLTLLGVAHAVTRRNTETLLLSGGLLGFWTGTVPGAIGGALLVLSAWVLISGGGFGFRTPGPHPPLVRAAHLVPAVGALLVLRGHLATEVTYGLVAVAIVAMALGRAAVDPQGDGARTIGVALDP